MARRSTPEGRLQESFCRQTVMCAWNNTSDADRNWGRPVSAVSWMSEARYDGVCPANDWWTTHASFLPFDEQVTVRRDQLRTAPHDPSCDRYCRPTKSRPTDSRHQPKLCHSLSAVNVADSFKMTADIVEILSLAYDLQWCKGSLLDCGKWLTVVVWQYARSVCLFLVLTALTRPSAHWIRVRDLSDSVFTVWPVY